MDLNLRDDEAALLQRVLSQYLAELRMEIRRTDDFAFRQGLKADADAIKAIIARLEPGVRRSA